MKKPLLIILLLFGCTREFTCDAGPPCVSETSETPDDLHTVQVLGTECDIRITVDWPDGKKEAEAQCDEIYNNDPMSVPPPEWIDLYSCTCEKAN
jgi:hypothetical protein